MIKKIIFFCSLLLLASQVNATAPVALGQTYPIIEDNLIDYLKAKAEQLEASGTWQALHQQAADNLEANLNQLPRLADISRTETAKSWLYDPSIRLPFNITDARGNVIAAKGERYNPLESVSLPQPLLFFDATDPEQVRFAQQQQQQHQVKLILVAGAYTQMRQQFNTPIYYDQQSKLTRKFGISHVPALVTQQDKQLRVQEVLLP